MQHYLHLPYINLNYSQYREACPVKVPIGARGTVVETDPEGDLVIEFKELAAKRGGFLHTVFMHDFPKMNRYVTERDSGG